MKKKSFSESKFDSKNSSGSQSQNNENSKTAKLNNRTQDDVDEMMREWDSRPTMVERVKATLAEIEAEQQEQLQSNRKSAKRKKDIWSNYELMSEEQRAKVDEAFDELEKVLKAYDEHLKADEEFDKSLEEENDIYDLLEENDYVVLDKEDIWPNYESMSEEQRAKCDKVLANIERILKECDERLKTEEELNEELEYENWEKEQYLEEERQREEWDKELEENGMFADE